MSDGKLDYPWRRPEGNSVDVMQQVITWHKPPVVPHKDMEVLAVFEGDLGLRYWTKAYWTPHVEGTFIYSHDCWRHVESTFIYSHDCWRRHIDDARLDEPVLWAHVNIPKGDPSVDVL